MLDIGWSELVLVGIVALIVVGPKELPRMFRTVGQYVGKARGMAREFQRAMDRAADDAGVTDIKDSINQAASIGRFDFDDHEESVKASRQTIQTSGPKPVKAATEHAERTKGKQATGERKAAPPETSSSELASPASASAKAGKPEEAAE